MFYRGRRLRNKKVPRNLIKENRLSVEQLISPIFVVAGNNIKKEISSLMRAFFLEFPNIKMN